MRRRLSRRQLRRMILSEIREVIYETDQPEEKENLNNQEITDLNMAIFKALRFTNPVSPNFDDAERLVAPYIDDPVVLNRLGQAIMKKGSTLAKMVRGVMGQMGLRGSEMKNWGTLLKKKVGISKLKSGKYPGLLALYKANA